MPIVAPVGSLLTQAARRDLFQDEFNEAVFMEPGQHLTRTLVFADKKAVDGGFMGIAGLMGSLGLALQKLQNGYVRSYATMMLAGLVILLIVVFAIQN